MKRIVAAKEARRIKLARAPIEEKIRVVVELQKLAAPILALRGKRVQAWDLDERSS